VRKFHPDIWCTILITDVSFVQHQLDAHTEVLTTSAIGVDPTKISKMETYYDQVEFATSLKPYLLRHLLSDGSKSVTFLDPDTQLYGNLNPIFKLAEKYDAILTPHRLTPFKQDPEFYSETTFLRYGTYNLGFISVGQSSSQLLIWWSDRLEFDCTRYPNDSIFTDQKWANQFPAYFNCHIYKAPDLNLAPWNLDERDLKIRDGEFHVGDIPLKMIHFSQMSSDLAAGRGTDLWGTTLDEARGKVSVLSLITKITDDYSNKLQEYANVRNPITFVKKPTRVQYPSFYRNLLRVQAIQQRSSSVWIGVTSGALVKLKFLERSETSVAIVRYFPSDVSKIFSYLSLNKKLRKPRRKE